MTGTLGHRCVRGVITPSVNTCVKPDCGAMRPRGVTSHLARTVHALRRAGIADPVQGFGPLLERH